MPRTVKRLNSLSYVLMRARPVSVLLLSALLWACADDRPFGGNERSADITHKNSVDIVSMVAQSAWLAPIHAPLFDLPDRADLAATAVVLPLEPGESAERISRFERACRISGRITYRFDEPTDNPKFPVKTSLRAVYESCDHGNGHVYHGQIDYRYTDFKGYNRSYQPVDTQTCVTELADQLEIKDEIAALMAQPPAPVKSTAKVKLITGSGKFIQFVLFGRNKAVRITREVTNDAFETELVTEDIGLIDLDDKAIVIFTPEGQFPEYAATIDGQIVYRFADRFERVAACHSYYRKAQATLRDFGFEREDFSVWMNGTVTLSKQSEELVRTTNRFEQSDFSVRVQQGALSYTNYFEDADVVKVVSQEHGTYSYNIGGLLKLDGIGNVQLTTVTSFVGQQGQPFLHEGNFLITGRNTESINVVPLDGYFLDVLVAPEGDKDGNNFPDYTLNYQISWTDLMDRYLDSTKLEDF